MADELPNSRPRPDEADCLAWVEGAPLPRDREQALSRALGEDRALARKLEAMRADRAAIRALPQVSAPAGLMASVEAALQPMLERQMLLGLREGASVNDHPPISIVQPVKRSIMQAFFADRVGRRLAMAAGLLLVVGGTTYLGTTYLSGRTAPKPSTIALNKDAKPAVGAPDLRIAAAAKNEERSRDKETGAAPANGSGGLAIAKAEPTAAPVEAPEARTDSAPEPTVQVADATEYGTWAVGPLVPDLDGARAAELAREGRLIIRVTAVDPGYRNGGVADRIRKADASMIRLGEEAPPALVQLLAPPTAPSESGPTPQPVYTPSVASDEPLNREGVPSFAPQDPAPSWTPPPAQTVYLVQVRLDSAALDALRGTLSGGYGEAQYEELNEPLQEGTTALNPASVVWWNQGPAGWKDWAGVPVVVDVNR